MRKISLRKNAAGEYCYCMRIIDNATGRQVRYAGNTYTGNRRDAEDFAWERIRPILQARTVEECLALRMRVLAGLKSIPISEAFDRAVAAGMVANALPRRKAQARHRWDSLSRWLTEHHPGVTAIEDITPAMAQAFVDSIGGAPATVSDYAIYVRLVFAFLANDSGLQRNPFDDITLPRGKQYGRRAFTLEQIQSIVHSEPSDMRDLFVIGMTTGLRLGDACMLRWDDVNLETGIVSVVTSKRKRPVRVPIMNPLRELLLSRRDGGEYVVDSMARSYMRGAYGPSYACGKFLNQLGIKTREVIDGRTVTVYGFHSCRHTFAYLAGIARVPQPIVQSILGHMSPDMTELYQRHVRDEDARQALTGLAGIFTGQS